MASSDEEGEIMPQYVTDYSLVTTDESIALLSSLPLCLTESVVEKSSDKEVFLRGVVDDGMGMIFKEVVGWKFEISFLYPEIFVLLKSKNWVKVQKPRKSYEEFMRSTLVTVYLLHVAKKNPDADGTYLWSQLQKLFSSSAEEPSENDIVNHIDLISAALSRDNDLCRSKYLLNIVKTSLGKEVTSFENAVPTARIQKIVVDDEASDAEKYDSEDEVDELFDRVCSLCDDGGNIVCCDGCCMRSFHATKEDGQASGCESLALPYEKINALSSFMCQNCVDQRHQCFACGMLGSSNIGTGAEVFPCVSATCGHFYHPVCVAKLIHPGDVTKAADIQNQIAKGDTYACPVHRCSVCKQPEDKTVDELQLAVCRRCPTSYHRKCIPKAISFERTENSPIRAWDGLLKKRVLIYCLKHVIDPELETPVRNHIIFSDTCRSGMAQASQQTRQMRNTWGSTTILQQRVLSNIPKPVDPSSKKAKTSSFQASFSSGKCPKLRFTAHPSNYLDSFRKPLLPGTNTSRRMLERSNLVDELLRGTSEPQVSQETERGSVWMKDIEKKCKSSSWSNSDQEATEKRIAALIKKSDASFNEIKFRSNMPVISTHSSTPRHMLDNAIPQGRVDAAVKAVREALRKLEEGGTLEEAKTICEPQILNQIMSWKRKLRVYLAPFLHGRRYTSYGRHFTKFEKLREVVNRLHNYVLDGDTIVDFCCGSNDFSCLMKKKLDEMGKHCSFKNYDIIQPKNDFCFENRDWMSVTPNELPAGCKLIMGLNPPFGVKASLANKFINKALEFKPKLIILIVPEETKRLDNKGAYKLIWEDRKILSGKAFYLPGSLDVLDKPIDQWNNSPTPLYLWSRSDWSNTHWDVAKQLGHIYMEPKEAIERGSSDVHSISNYLMEENRDCYKNFPRIMPENTVISRISDDIPDHEYSNEKELDEVVLKKRKYGVYAEDSVLNGGEINMSVEEEAKQFVAGTSSFASLPAPAPAPAPAQSYGSLRRKEPCLLVYQANNKSSSTNMQPEMVKTTQGFLNFMSVPAKSDLGPNAKVNLNELEKGSQFKSVGAAVGANNFHTSINYTSAASILGGRSWLDFQPNLGVQPYLCIPELMQQNYWHGYFPYGNYISNQDYHNYYQANNPQDAHLQYVPQSSVAVDPYTNGAHFYQTMNPHDDLPPIPGLGGYPSSYPKP